MNKPAVPPPSKMRRAADQLLPISDNVEEPVKPQVPSRAKLMTIAEGIDFKAPDNLSSSTADKWKDLNFKVDEHYHRRIKRVASNWGLSMKELLEAAMENWINEHGEGPKSTSDFDRFRDERKKRA